MTHNPAIITVSGSHGTLRVHRPTGIIVERLEACDCGECANGYDDIAWFDPAVFAHDPEVTYWDILACGYWSPEGVYTPGWTIRDRSGPCMIRGRVMWFYEDFDDWVPFALLPAPARTVDQHVAEAMQLEVRDMHDKLTRWAPMLERMAADEAGSARVRLMDARDSLFDMWRQLRAIAA